MEATARFYVCARCRCQVVICSYCDRGQRYCSPGCARIARRKSIREAGQRYQNSRRGRHSHAARQRRYRRRQQEKVTHQGSPASAVDDSLKVRPERGSEPSVAVRMGAIGSVICSFCARVCSEFLRLGVIRRRNRRRSPCHCTGDPVDEYSPGRRSQDLTLPPC